MISRAHSPIARPGSVFRWPHPRRTSRMLFVFNTAVLKVRRLPQAAATRAESHRRAGSRCRPRLPGKEDPGRSGPPVRRSHGGGTVGVLHGGCDRCQTQSSRKSPVTGPRPVPTSSRATPLAASRPQTSMARFMAAALIRPLCTERCGPTRPGALSAPFTWSPGRWPGCSRSEGGWP